MKKRTLTDVDIELLREVFPDKDEVREIVQEEMSYLPTKDEFYIETAKIYKKQNDLEEEKDVLAYRVSKHSDQIERIQKHINLVDIE